MTKGLIEPLEVLARFRSANRLDREVPLTASAGAAHDLRRSVTATLDRRGVPVREVSFLLRHLTLDESRVYFKANPLGARTHIETLVIDVGAGVSSHM